MDRIALVSDIHGNLPALEAVARDLRALSPDVVWVLGDMVNGAPWTAEVMDMILSAGWPMLMGNHDDAVLQLGTPLMEERYRDRRRYGMLWWTREQLAPRHLDALAAAPLRTQLGGGGQAPMYLCHGLPGNIYVGFRPDSPEGWCRRHLEGLSERYVGTGHTHVPMVRQIARWTVINAGAVGVSYDGDTRASWALLSGGRDGWSAEIRRVPYDLQAVSAGFASSGLDVAGGAMAAMFARSIETAQPWIADFAWWLRRQGSDGGGPIDDALRAYERAHGPGRWAFPYAT